jgi:hypoxanthine phosphoribosyltransferase
MVWLLAAGRSRRRLNQRLYDAAPERASSQPAFPAPVVGLADRPEVAYHPGLLGAGLERRRSRMNQHELSVLISEQAIQRRVDELAAQISSDYVGTPGVLLIGVLKGAFVFLADLARRLTIPNEVDFIALSSYRGEAISPGAVRLVMDLREDMADRHVLIVEDIVDTGHTLAYLDRTLSGRGPASLKCCTLLRKQARHEVDVDLDYVGFDIDDVWVVGYGLDYADRYRMLPYIATFDPDS